MHDPRFEPPSAPPPPPMDLDDPDYHCPNCAFLEDPSSPGSGFWACQNLCIRQ